MKKSNRNSAKSVKSLAAISEVVSSVAVLEPEVSPVPVSDVPAVSAIIDGIAGETNSGPSISDAEFSAIIAGETLPETFADAIRSLPDSAFFPAPAPRVSNLAPAFTTAGSRDALGFGSDSEVSFLIRAILSGGYTRPALLAAFLAKFTDGSEAEAKRKKTSFSVFFSDVKRPFGTYYASRALPIRVSDTGILSFDPDRYATVTAAVASGILPDLKGLSPSRTPEKLAKVREKYGVNFPGEK